MLKFQRLLKIVVPTLILAMLLNVSTAFAGSFSVTKNTSLPEGRFHGGAEYINGKIYLVAGAQSTSSMLNTTVIYDPSTNQTSMGANIPTARYTIGETAAIGDKIYVAGGNIGNTQSNAFEVYDTTKNSWSKLANISTARFGVSMAAYNDEIYIIGGKYDVNDVKNVEKYSPLSNTWSTLKAISTARRYAGSAVIGNQIFVFGGGTGSTLTPVNSVEVYTPSTNTWVTKSNLPTPRWGFNTVTKGNKVYLVGGSNTSGYVTQIDVYDTLNDSWSTLDCKLPEGLAFSPGILIDNTMYLFGGSNAAGLSNSIYSFDLTDISCPTLQVNKGSDNSLTWNEIEDAKGYQLLRSEQSGGPYSLVADNLSSTSYKDSGLEEGKNYYYVVRAFNDLEVSCNSNEVTLIGKADPAAGRAILTIYLTNGIEKEFDLSMVEVNAFIDWYDQKADGVGPAKYAFNKDWNLGPFSKRTEYLIFDKILTFEVSEYNTAE